MTSTVQVIYPIKDDTNFDYDYYLSTHMELVQKYMGEFLQDTLVTKGLAGPPVQPTSIYAIATLVFADEAAMMNALKASEPVMNDIPNFTNTMPEIVLGEVVG